MKINRKFRKMFNLYNLAVLIAIIVIIVSMIIILKPEGQEQKNVTPGGIEIIDTGVVDGEEITEQKAREIAVKQFQSLGENNLKEESLQVKTIRRDEEEFYYVSSMENTIEIKIKGGKITRINSASVEE